MNKTPFFLLFAYLLAAQDPQTSTFHSALPPDRIEKTDTWLKIGSFSGGYESQFEDIIENEIFKEYQRGSFYRELGNLHLKLPLERGDGQLSLQAEYKRRIHTSQLEKAEGDIIQRTDLSGYRIFNGAITKTKLKIDYAQDLLDTIDVGVEIEAGFSLAISKYQGSQVHYDAPLDRVNRGPFGEELEKYWARNRIRLDRQILKDTGKSMIGLVDLIMGGVSRPFIDREKSAFFVEDYVEPMQLYADLGVPLDPSLFDPKISSFQPGDMVNYSIFIGFAPLAAYLRKFGISASYKKFARYIREITFVIQDDGRLLVHMENAFLLGDERVPFRIRPELKLLIFRLGHTFVNNQYDRFKHTTGSIQYLLDLKTPQGKEKLQELIQTGQIVQKPRLEEICEDTGVNVKFSSFRKGEKHENSNLWRFFNLFRFENDDLNSRQEIFIDGRRFQEAKRLRVLETRNHTLPKRNRNLNCLVALLTELPEESNPIPYPLDAHLQIALRIEDRLARPEDLDQLAAALLYALPGERTEDVLARLAPGRKLERPLGVALSLDLHFNQMQLRRIREIEPDWLWRKVAAYYLGPDQEHAWLTPKLRRDWLFSERIKIRSRRFGHPDRHSFVRPKSQRYRTASGFMARDVGSPDIFLRRAEKAVADLLAIRHIQSGRDFLGEPLAPFEDFRDLALVLGILVKAGAGPYSEPIGQRVELFADGMPRSYLSQNPEFRAMKSPERISPDIMSLRDASPRLRAGQVLLQTGRLRDPMGQASPLRLEVFSDHLFESGMVLRTNLREARLRADNSLKIDLLPLPVPEVMMEGPFKIAKYRYVFEVNWRPEMKLGETFNIEMRVLNQDGRAVTEEQLLKFKLPSQQFLKKKLGIEIHASD